MDSSGLYESPNSNGLRRRETNKSSPNSQNVLLTGGNRSGDDPVAQEKSTSSRLSMKRSASLFIPLSMMIVGVILFVTSKSVKSESPIETNGDWAIHMRGSKPSSPCFVYFAPSSVSGGGMGLFTTKSLRKGEVILESDGPSIPVIDPDMSEESLSAWVRLFQNYWWASGVAQSASFEADYVVEFQTGAGGLPNSHGYLNNIRFENVGLIPYDDSRLDRAIDPAAGAITYSTGRRTVARTDMEAGEEFFMRYPENYMNYISKKYHIPKRGDYERVGNLVSTLFEKYGIDPYDWRDTEELSYLPRRATSLLPKTKYDMKRVLLSARRSRNPSNIALAVAKEMSVEKRTAQWIKKNGVCMDNLVQRKSTNPRAGQGVIANRFMKKGDIIAPAPVLHITDRDALRMPAFRGDNWQLLLNYCIGHEHSSLLLCPNTNANLINHCSERRREIHPCVGGNGPNARYRWAEWDQVSNDWRSKTIEEMEQTGGKGLMLEVQATRNIEEGEEVFIDYGVNFEKAWDEHVLEWESKNKRSDHEWTSAKELNDEMGALTVAPDFSEEYISTDSRGILFTGCHYYEDDESFWDAFDSYEPWEEMSVNRIINRYGNLYGDAFDLGDEPRHGLFWPCVVTRQEKTNRLEEEVDSYIVRIMQLKSQPETIWERKRLPRIIRNFPRASIRHFYLPYSSDIHLSDAFRHPVELSDEMFPPMWKNRQ